MTSRHNPHTHPPKCPDLMPALSAYHPPPPRLALPPSFPFTSTTHTTTPCHITSLQAALWHPNLRNFIIHLIPVLSLPPLWVSRPAVKHQHRHQHHHHPPPPWHTQPGHTSVPCVLMSTCHVPSVPRVLMPATCFPLCTQGAHTHPARAHRLPGFTQPCPTTPEAPWWHILLLPQASHTPRPVLHEPWGGGRPLPCTASCAAACTAPGWRWPDVLVPRH